MKQHSQFPVLAVSAVAIVALGTALLFFSDSISGDERMARDIVTSCANEENRALCYEKKVPALMDEGVTMEHAFGITRILQEIDKDYHYCHVLAHNISSKETAKDLSKWKDVVARAPSGVCGNGGLHGAFQERFRRESWPDASTEEIAEELDGACDPREHWNPTHLERSSCMHGLGHLFMYVTEADIRTSVALCEKLSVKDGGDFRRTCIDGSFMQIFQPLEPEDEGLVEKIAPATAEVPAFCGAFTDLAHTSCFKESWPHLRGALVTPEGFASLCEPIQGNFDEYQYCASGEVYVAFGMLEYDTDKMMPLCQALDEPLRSICVSRTASRFVETDWKNIPQALSVCSHAESSLQDACFKELVNFAIQGLPKGSNEAKALCGGIPEMWRRECETATVL